ncbi:MAG: anti-sigma factor [Burkholderiales bacterium]|nr:MAG: anti-sigma factor [Burkholderiales bacterium]
MSTPDVELRLPAQSPFVAVIRMMTAGLAARVDFTIDDIEDLRMAVGEACALVLDVATEDASLFVRCDLGEGQMGLAVSVDAAEGHGVDMESFAWQVLSALVEDLQESSGPDGTTVTFTVTSTKG